MKRNLFTKINGTDIRIVTYSSGKCAPMADDLLRIVGLEALIPEIETFYDLLGYVGSEKLLKWMAYTADMTCRNAFEKLRKYLLLDAGCRAQFAQTEAIQIDEVDTLGYFLSAIEEDHFYSYKELADLISNEGFEII